MENKIIINGVTLVGYQVTYWELEKYCIACTKAEFSEDELREGVEDYRIIPIYDVLQKHVLSGYRIGQDPYIYFSSFPCSVCGVELDNREEGESNDTD